MSWPLAAATIPFGPLAAALAAALLAAAVPGGEAAEAFPEVTNSEPAARGGPPPAAEAAAGVTLPPGFAVTVMAAEPEVQNPIAMAWDDRGRLWVAENYTYAERQKRFDLALRDRLLVFEDVDGDGRFDVRKVFSDSVQMLTGIEVGHGGVWLICPPRLLFIPDRDRDDVPDGDPVTVLDGFVVAEANYHNFANGIRFGPDGWLYGRCGHSCPARIGPPGCPDDRRLPMHGGMWRYSPRSGRVEVLATGTTNPWGHDWTAEGECFFVNTVNGHLWHLIPGGHFRQMRDVDPNPWCYETIDHHADHFHFDTGAGWQNSRHGLADDFGGGHAHSGCLIYGGLNWPEEYRGRLFTLNFHGRRANQELLERSGSGYLARHGRDCFHWADEWFRGMDLASGPDGSVVVIDWSDTGECHEHDGVHRTSGRIYRLAHGRPRLPAGIERGFDLGRLDDEELARLQAHPDAWWVARSRLVLAERAASRRIDRAAIDRLQAQLLTADALAAADPRLTPAAVRVRAMLALHLVGGLGEQALLEQLGHPDEHVRTWAVRLLTEDWPLDAALGPVPQSEAEATRVGHHAAAMLEPLVALARSDPSGLVRLALASTLQRLPVPLRPPLAKALVARSEDAGDHNLPLLVWYGLGPLATVDAAALVDVADRCRWPTTRRLIARRLARSIDERSEAVARLLDGAAAAAAGGEADRLADTLAGLAEGLAGRRRPPRPGNWERVGAVVAALPPGDAEDRCRRLAAELGLAFGDDRAVAAVRRVALDAAADREARRGALATLIEARPPGLRELCEQLLADPAVQAEAARGLTLFDDQEAAAVLVEAARQARGQAREAVFAALGSRVSFAAALLEAVERGRLRSGDLSAAVVRQIHALGDRELSGRCDAAWGQVRETPAEKRGRIEALRELLAAAGPQPPDLAAGRLLYERTCGGCHRLYGEGGGVGPDLTGSGRHDLGYLLENVVDPSGVVAREWRLSVVTLADGRVLTGVIVERTGQTTTIQGLQERQTIAAEEIEEIATTDRSPMPDGLLDQLTDREVRDLVAYLRHPRQVPRPR